jgi:hypothetical protein
MDLDQDEWRNKRSAEERWKNPGSWIKQVYHRLMHRRNRHGRKITSDDAWSILRQRNPSEVELNFEQRKTKALEDKNRSLVLRVLEL